MDKIYLILAISLLSFGIKAQMPVNETDLVQQTNSKTLDNWTPVSSGATGNMESIRFIDENNGWAVGWKNTILRTIDGGLTWASATSGVTEYAIRDIYFIDNNTGWAVGGNGSIFKSIDGGDTWATQTSGITAALFCVWFTDANTGFAAGEFGKRVKTIDGGATWLEQDMGTNNIFDMYFDGNTGYQVGYQKFYKSTNGGDTWTETYTFENGDYIRNIQVKSSTEFYAGGYNTSADPDQGFVYKTTNGGSSWTKMVIGEDEVYSTCFTSSTEGYAVGGSYSVGMLWKTTNGGTNWTLETLNEAAGASFTDIIFPAANIGLALGNKGLIYRLEKSVASIEPAFSVNTSTGSAPLLVQFTDESTGDITSWNWNFGDGTTSTEQSPSHTYTTAGKYSVTLEITDGTNTKVSTHVNGIYVSETQNTREWTLQTTDIGTESLSGVHFINDLKGFATGKSGNMYKTKDGGSSWSKLNLGTNLQAVDFVDPNAGYIGGYATIHRTLDGGVTWVSIAPAGLDHFIYDIEFINKNYGYAVGYKSGDQTQGGKIYVTRDGGSTWENKYTFGHNVLKAICFPSESTGYVVGESNALVKTTDYGETWTQIDPDAGTSYQSVYFIDENTGFVGASSGRLFKTTNGGTNWKEISLDTHTDIHGIYFVNSTLGYACTTNGMISVTTDGGETWTKEHTSGNGLSDIYFKNENIGFAVGSGGDVYKYEAVETVTADFTADVTSGDAPLTVNFTDNSTGTPTSWSWDFDNDGAEDANIQNPSYTYNTAGTYTVSLTVGNGSDTDIKTRNAYIVVNEKSCNDLSQDYIMNFEDGDDLSDWILIDGNGDDSKWGVFAEVGIDGSDCAGYKFSSSNVANDWLISSCFDLQAGTDYEVNFYYAVAGSTFPEKMKVYYGTEQDASMSNLIVDFGELTNEAFIKSSNRISITESGNYYIGWYCYSEADQYNLYIDSVVVKVAGAIEEVNAAFSADVTTGAAPLTVQFSDQSTGNPTSWSWDFNNDGVEDSNVQNPVINFVDVANYTVKLTVSNENSTDTETKTNYISTTATGVNDLSNLENIKIYPNPATSEFFVNLENSEATEAEVEIVGLNGQTIQSEKIDLGNGPCRIDTHKLNSGIYMVRIQAKEKTLIKKLIIE